MMKCGETVMCIAPIAALTSECMTQDKMELIKSLIAGLLAGCLFVVMMEGFHRHIGK
jgi:hypothetical protein